MDRLSHTQRVSIRIKHPVDTRAVFGMSAYVFAEGGGGHERLKFFRRSGVNLSRFDFRFSFGKLNGKGWGVPAQRTIAPAGRVPLTSAHAGLQ